MPSVVPFRLFRHLPLVDVTLDGYRHATFVLDTGVGVTVVSSTLLQELEHPPSGKVHVGRRMTGQEIAVPLSQVNLLRLGGHSQARPEVGCFDLSGFPLENGPPGGFLSLTFFESTPVTLDYASRELYLRDSESPADPSSTGTPVPIEVTRKGLECEVFLEIQLPNGRRVKAEVDTGSDTTFLHSRFMAELGVVPGAPGVAEARGTDDFGKPYIRYETSLPGPLCVAAQASIAQASPKVIFMDLIYDAVVGHDFLKSFRVTFDVSGAHLNFAPASQNRTGGVP